MAKQSLQHARSTAELSRGERLRKDAEAEKKRCDFLKVLALYGWSASGAASQAIKSVEMGCTASLQLT